MEWGLLLLLLICPIMMMFMMKGHNHGGHHNHGKHDHNQHSNEQIQPSKEAGRLDSYKVKQLEGELEQVKKQNESLQHELKKH